jgi:hypothetical protein
VESINARFHRLERTVASHERVIYELETAVDTLLTKALYAGADAVGFNGQLARKKMFCELLDAWRPDAIVETGTWLGNTTGYMAETSSLPVYSAELRPRYFAIAKLRLGHLPQVTVVNADSRRFLENLALSGELRDKRVLFYLDAHWYDDLPLNDELSIIGANWKDCIVIVDDFQVPFDDGYGHDDFGSGRALTPELIEDVVKEHSFRSFYPSASSNAETGDRRGCVVLASNGETSELLESLSSLRSN